MSRTSDWKPLFTSPPPQGIPTIQPTSLYYVATDSNFVARLTHTITETLKVRTGPVEYGRAHGRQDNKVKKINAHYTGSIAPKRVTSGGVHLHGIAPEQHSSEATSEWLRAVGDTVSDLTGQVIERKISRTAQAHFAVSIC